MASLDHRLKPLFSIKECMTCGALYTADFVLCKSCGNGAHIGYNCPPKAPIISNPEPCNQTIDEFPQTLPSVHPTCNSGDENSFTYDSKPNSVDDSLNVFNPPPQPLMYSCEFCGNDARYGHYCTPQFPLVYEQEPCYNQNFNDNYFPQNSQSSSQQYNCCENCGGPHETFHCQPMNEDYYEQNSCYDPNSFGFDQFQPQQYTVNHPILNAQNEFLNSQNKLMEQMTSICDMVGQIMQKKEEERRIAEDQAAKDRYWKIPICYDDDEDYTIAITPVLSTKEPVDSLIMEDEHLDTIPATESDEVIKSSVENLVPIPSESDGISEGECDLPIYDDFSSKKDDVLDDIISIPPGNGNDHFNAESSLIESVLNRDNVISSHKINFLIEEFAGEFAPIPPGMDEDEFDEEEVDCYDHDISSDDESYENIEYVEASPLNLEYDSLEEENEDQEEKEFDLEDIFQIQDSPISVTDSGSFFEESDTFLSHLDNSLPEFETFSDHTEETISGSTTTHANNSLPEYDSFLFEIGPDQGGLTSIVISDNTNDPSLWSFLRYEIRFHLVFDLSFPRPPPEPPDVEISLIIETNAPVINDFDELNEDECFDPGGGEINVEVDNSFTFVIWIFLPYLTYPVVSSLLSSTKNEDTIFDPGIST
ncbi:hypothetical protein Tco_0720949 [Tanacetum coccineum]